MKPLFFGVAIWVVGFCAAAFGASGNSVAVEVSGIKRQTGRISIGLFNRPDEFPDQKAVFKGTFVDIDGERVQYVFDGIPAGKYAIAVYHDVNANGKMDTNFLKIPKEPFGFSRNAKPSFGPPDFEDAAFSVEGAVEIKIELRH